MTCSNFSRSVKPGESMSEAQREAQNSNPGRVSHSRLIPKVGSSQRTTKPFTQLHGRIHAKQALERIVHASAGRATVTAQWRACACGPPALTKRPLALADRSTEEASSHNTQHGPDA